VVIRIHLRIVDQLCSVRHLMEGWRVTQEGPTIQISVVIRFSTRIQGSWILLGIIYTHKAISSPLCSPGGSTVVGRGRCKMCGLVCRRSMMTLNTVLSWTVLLLRYRPATRATRHANNSARSNSMLPASQLAAGDTDDWHSLPLSVHPSVCRSDVLTALTMQWHTRTQLC